MRFGFHVTIKGGLFQAALRAHKLGCDCLQLFSRNPRSWQTKDLDEKDVEKFKKALIDYGIKPCIVHLPYLPNLASSKKDLLTKSVFAFNQDIDRAKKIGARFLVVHMGSRGKQSEKEAIKVMAESINRVLPGIEQKLMLLLENTSGAGSQLGYCFEHFSEIFNRLKNPDAVGICLDTAHAFAAGHKLHKKRGLKKTLDQISRYVGMEKIKLLHLNDSAVHLGSHKDRHWHIGKGYMGKRAFKRIINHPLLAELPAIMETPRKSDEDDLMNMRIIRSLV
jgi:deoxyribonuclease-4